MRNNLESRPNRNRIGAHRTATGINTHFRLSLVLLVIVNRRTGDRRSVFAVRSKICVASSVESQLSPAIGVTEEEPTYNRNSLKPVSVRRSSSNVVYKLCSPAGDKPGDKFRNCDSFGRSSSRCSLGRRVCLINSLQTFKCFRFEMLNGPDWWDWWDDTVSGACLD